MHQVDRRAALRKLALTSTAFAGASLVGWPLQALAATGDLTQIKAKGVLTVAVYDEQPPFNVKGAGIDISLGKAIAERLGVRASFLPFGGGDSMDDDLRAMVWKGHYLGYGPADLMLHVPVDRPLMVGNPQVRIFAPYYRERVMIARDRKAIAELNSLSGLKGSKVAVSGASLPGWLLASADDGALQSLLTTTYMDGAAAALALKNGEVQAAGGLQSELESVLLGDPRFVIEAIPSPRAPIDGWVIGCAVRKDATALGDAVQAAISSLADDGQIRSIFQTAKVEWRRP
jgi:ABC-type amino acid transport substrate-binding protein